LNATHLSNEFLADTGMALVKISITLNFWIFSVEWNKKREAQRIGMRIKS